METPSSPPDTPDYGGEAINAVGDFKSRYKEDDWEFVRDGESVNIEMRPEKGILISECWEVIAHRPNGDRLAWKRYGPHQYTILRVKKGQQKIQTGLHAPPEKQKSVVREIAVTIGGMTVILIATLLAARKTSESLSDTIHAYIRQAPSLKPGEVFAGASVPRIHFVDTDQQECARMWKVGIGDRGMVVLLQSNRRIPVDPGTRSRTMTRLPDGTLQILDTIFNEELEHRTKTYVIDTDGFLLSEREDLQR